METKNELDDLLKRSMQFNNGELPEPDSGIQKRLRKQVAKKKIYSNNGFISGLLKFLNLDIKLYHAGIGLAVMLVIFMFLRNGCETPAAPRQGPIIADTNTGSGSFKEDSFLLKSKNIN